MPTKCTPVLAGIDPENARQEWINENNVELSGLLDQLNTNMAQYNFYFQQLENEDSNFTDLLDRELKIGEFDRTELIRFVNGNVIDVLATLDNFNANEFANNSTGIGGEYFTRALLLKGTAPDLATANYNQTFKEAGGIGQYSNDYETGSFTPAQVEKYGEMVRVIGEVYSDVKPKLEALFNEYSLLTTCLQLLEDKDINELGEPTDPDNIPEGVDAISALAAQNNLSSAELGSSVFTIGAPSAPQIDFKEQCFLLAHIFNLTKIKERLDHGVSGVRPSNVNGYKELPDVNQSRNRTILVDGEPFGIVNALTQSPSKNLFFEMTNEQLSTLQPKIRLFKVVPTNSEGDNTCKEKEVEIVFDPYDLERDITRMFSKNMGVRGIGVGLKSFDFSYEADNPFAIKKSISAKLVIHANTFSELLIERNNSTEPYSYIDLALKTGNRDTITFRGGSSQVHVDNLEKLNFKLKAVVGWKVPVANRGIFSPDLLNAIYDSSISLNLTPTVHTFDLDENGRVTFTINYLAYSEDYFDNANFNVFTEKEVFQRSIEREIITNALNLQIEREEVGAVEEGPAAEKKKEILNDTENAQQIKDDKETSLKFLMNSLIEKMYYINFDQQDAQLYGFNSPFSQASEQYPTVESLEQKVQPVKPDTEIATDVSEQIDVAADAVGEGTQDNQDNNSILRPPSSASITFFYAADLIDTILKNIKESLDNIATAEFNISEDIITIVGQNTIDCLIQDQKDKYARLSENYQKLRIMLGPLEITEPNSFNFEVRNLGDVPISVKGFMEFLTTKMINLEKTQYFMTQFINDFFNEFVVNMLNRDICYNGRATQRLFLHQNAFTEYRDDLLDQDTITKLCNNPNIGINPDFQVKCPDSSSETCTKRLYLDIKPPALPLELPILNIMGVRNDPRSNPGLCLEYNYLFFYAGRSIPMNQMVGCKQPYTKQDSNGSEQFGCFNSKGDKVGETGDHSRGIWHYQIGKDRGIVKTISLSKTDSTGLAEVRFEQEGYDGLKQLRVLYDVTIKSFLDVSAFPGNYIYVEPRGFDIGAQTPDGIDLTQIGIGGYHMIYKTDHTISPGTVETTIHAKWVAANSPSKEITPPPTADAAPAKCSTP